jgi:DNA repair protein RecO (recombination protein O)
VLHKTRGIVFRFTKYAETSIIVTIFTEQFGIQTYIVNSVRSKSGRGKIALYQPLTLLDLVVYHKENAPILRLKEVRCVHPYQSITADFKKSTIALFLTEMVNKSIKEQTHTKEICDFLFDSFIILDQQTIQVENFHLIFLIRLSSLLGFGATHTSEMLTPFFSDDDEEKILTQLLKATYHSAFSINQIQRRNLLDVLVRFYAQHIEGLGEIRSLAVVRDLIN